MTYPILRYFAFSHLPPHLQEVSKQFFDLAHRMADIETDNPAEVAVGLRKLLEAKDAFVRARLDD